MHPGDLGFFANAAFQELPAAKVSMQGRHHAATDADGWTSFAIFTSYSGSLAGV
jgi:hypothetical protein